MKFGSGRMSLFIAIIVGIAHVFLSVYGSSMSRGGDPIYSVLAETLLWFVFLVLFVAVWKYYCLEWKKLSSKSSIRVLLDKLFYPAISVVLIGGSSHYSSNFLEGLVVASGITLLFALIDIDSSIGRSVATIFSDLNVTNRKMLYSRYPPKSRADILPMDLIVNIWIIVMIIKKVT